MSAKDLIETVKSTMGKHAPIILTSISVAGVVGTAICASHDTLMARNVLDQMADEEPDATRKEQVMRVAPCYIPTLLMGGATIACIIGAHAANTGKIAAYASAYSLAQEAASKYRDSVKEVVSKQEAEEIEKKYSEGLTADHLPGDREILELDDGKQLCYDSMTGRYFRSDVETLRHIQNDLNHQLLQEMWLSLNNFYYAAGLAPVNIGEELGWDSDHLIELRFTAILTSSGVPCVVVDFETRPTAEFYRKY